MKSKENKINKMISLKIIKIIIYVSLFFIIISILSVKLNKGKTIITANSILINVKEVKELDVAKFEYGGIAYYFEDKEDEYFTNESGKKADVKIKYNALVIAKINLEDIDKDKIINVKEKKIYLKMPKIKYIINILSNSQKESKEEIDKNFETMGTVKDKYSLNSLRKVCKVDAKHEIDKNDDIKKYVIQIAKTTIEGLIFPKINETEYKIVWEEEK